MGILEENIMNADFIELTQFNTLPISVRRSSVDGYARRDGMGITRVLLNGISLDVKETYDEITEKMDDTIYTKKTEYTEILKSGWETEWIETYFGDRIRVSRIIEYKDDPGVGMVECILDNGRAVAVKTTAADLDAKLGRLAVYK
jgi:hypothetical protein